MPVDLCKVINDFEGRRTALLNGECFTSCLRSGAYLRSCNLRQNPITERTVLDLIYTQPGNQGWPKAIYYSINCGSLVRLNLNLSFILATYKILMFVDGEGVEISAEC